MAYKFQRGEANLSGSIELQSAAAELSLSKQDGAKHVELTQAGVISGSAQLHGGKLTIDSVDVVTGTRQLANIASLDATTEGTIESAIDTLANLASAGTNGQELEFLGSIDAAQGVKVNNVSFADASRNVSAGTVTATGVVSSSADARFGALDIEGVERISAAGIVKPSAISASFGSTLTMADTAFQVSNAGAMQASTISGSSDLLVGGTVRVDGVAQAAVDVAGDFVLFLDDTDQLVKKEAVGDFAADLAGTGLEQNANTIRIAAAAAGNGLSGGGGSALALDLNELSAATINVAADSIAIIDADDSNASKKESIADLVDGIAGGGLTALNGVLSTQAGAVRLIDFSTTLLEGYNYYTGSANKAVNLPASPSVGDVVYVKAQDLGDGNSVTISRQGSHTIDGETSISLESDYAAVGFVYLVANNWGII